MQNLQILQKKIAEIVKKSPIDDKIQAVYIFGSYAKNKQSKASDLDVLITLTAPTSGFDFIDLENELTEQLGIKTDLVAEDAISPYLKDEINTSKHLVYER